MATTASTSISWNSYLSGPVLQVWLDLDLAVSRRDSAEPGSAAPRHLLPHLHQNWWRLGGKWGHEVLEDAQSLRGQGPEKRHVLNGPRGRRGAGPQLIPLGDPPEAPKTKQDCLAAAVLEGLERLRGRRRRRRRMLVAPPEAACEEAAGSGTVTAEDSGGVEAEAEAWRRWLRLRALAPQ